MLNINDIHGSGRQHYSSTVRVISRKISRTAVKYGLRTALHSLDMESRFVTLPQGTKNVINI